MSNLTPADFMEQANKEYEEMQLRKKKEEVQAIAHQLYIRDLNEGLKYKQENCPHTNYSVKSDEPYRKCEDCDKYIDI